MRARAKPTGFRRIRRPLLLCLLLVMAPPLLAQDTGQLCVRSFDDRDGDGLRGPDEGAIAHGVSAGLRNPAGVIIATLLLEDSPFADNGILCFDQLRAGDYQISLRSAEYASTTAAAFAASVNPGDPPALLEFGLQPLRLTEPSRPAPDVAIDAALVEAVLRGTAGAAIVAVILCLILLLIYLVVSRRRSSPPPRPMRQRQTDS